MADLPIIAPDPVTSSALPVISPDPPPAAAQASDGLPVIAPDQPASPQGAQPGFFPALFRGMGESVKGLGETGSLVSGTATPAQPQADDALNQELQKSFFKGMFDPHWWTSQIGHAIGSAGPMVGGAFAGAAAGEAVAPEGVILGPLVGGAVGGGLGNMIQTLGPTVKQNMAQGQNFNDALDSALKTTGMESTIVGAMSAVPGGNLLKNFAITGTKKAIAEALVNILGVQPAIGAAGQEAIAAVEDKPLTLDDLLTGYVQNAGMGAAFHGASLLRGKPSGAPADELPPRTPPQQETASPPLQQSASDQVAPKAPPAMETPGPGDLIHTTEQSGPVPSGEQVVKSGAPGVNAKTEIIDEAPLRFNGDPYNNVREMEADRQTVAAEQAKRQRLLAFPDALRAHADSVGETPEAMAKILADNHAAAAPRLASLEGYLASPEAQTRAAQEQARTAGIRFTDQSPPPGPFDLRAQPLDAAPPPTLRGPEFSPEQVAKLPEIKPDGWTTEPPHTIDVYHGSPHMFDDFASGKIGTGEGAASYGRGDAYLAENPDVAQGYADTLSKETFKTPGGETFNPASLEHLNVRVAARKNGPDLDATIARAQELLPDMPPETQAMLQRDIAKLEGLKAQGGIEPNTGHLYKAQILGHPDEFLDWDKHLDEQSPQVQAYAQRLGYADPKITGEQLFRARSEDGDPDLISHDMSEAGIKGIRYLDQQSRDKGEGTRNYVVFDAKHVRALERNGTPIQRVLETKSPSEPMPQHVTDEIAQGAHATNDDIGQMLLEAAGGGGGREPPAGGGTPPGDPGGRRRKLMSSAAKETAAINLMPNDPLSFHKMAKITRVLGTMPGVAADDHIIADYLSSLSKRDADKHSLTLDGSSSAEAYGKLLAKRQEPINKLSEYFDATGQEIPEPHKDGSLTVTMDPRPFGELPWMLQLSEPGEKVHLDPEQVKALQGVRDFLHRRHWEDAESKARQFGYDGPFLKTGADGKQEADLAAIKRVYETTTDKGSKKAAERALGIATAATERYRTSYWPRARYGDYVFTATPKVPLDGTGHALPGERWVSKIEATNPWDSFKGIFKSTYGNAMPRKVMAEVARLEKRFPSTDYNTTVDKPPPRLRDELNVPMIERALDDVDFTPEDWKTLADAGRLRSEDLDALKEAFMEKLYQKMMAGFRQHRDNVPGASTDLSRALGDYIRQSSNAVAAARHSRAVDDAYLNTQLHRDPTTRSYVAAHKKYNEGAESRVWSAARMVAFSKYLWGSPMSALLQLSQTPMVTGSQLTGVIGPRAVPLVANALRQALQAMRVDGRGVKVAIESLKGHVTPEEYAHLMRQYREGRLNPVLPQDMAGGTMSARTRRSLPIPSRIYDIGGSMFNAADTVNRVASSLAYFRAAKLPGAAAKFAKAYKNEALFQKEVGDHVDPGKLSDWGVNETQFMSGRMGGAPITHGIGSLAFQFQHYNWNFLRLLHKNFTKMGPQGKVAGTLMLAGLVGTGGLLGLPFAKDAEQGADAIWKFVTGIDPRFDANLRELMGDNGLAHMADQYMGWTPGTTGEMATEGPSRQLTGLDLGNRLALGNLLPGSTDLMSGVPFLEATVGAAIEAKNRFAKQQPLGAIAAMMPAGIQNPMKALSVYPNEGVKQQSGTNVFSPSEVTTGMKIARGLGATPAPIARRQQALADKNAITYATDEATKNLKAAIVGQYGLFEDAMKQGDTARAAAYAAKAQQLIRDNLDRLSDPSIEPYQQIPLPSPGQIRSGIMKYMNPFQIRNSKAMRSKQAELSSSPYLQQ